MDLSGAAGAPTATANSMLNNNVLMARGMGKVVKSGTSDLVILREIDLAVTPGEAVAIVGASGSGKSTLLAILAGLDTPSSGKIELDGVDIFSIDEDARAALRGRSVGFVFQSFQLLPALTALENTTLPLELAGRADAEAMAREALARAGLAERLHHYPKHPSGGGQQRAAPPGGSFSEAGAEDARARLAGGRAARARPGARHRRGERDQRRVLRRPRQPGAGARR